MVVQIALCEKHSRCQYVIYSGSCTRLVITVNHTQHNVDVHIELAKRTTVDIVYLHIICV